MTVRVVVDTYERESRLVDALHALEVETERRRLDVGDYLAGSCVVERKAVRDLHLSIMRSRFWPQVGRLSRVGGIPYLLIEGSDLNGPLRRAAVRGALVAVSELGIGVIRSQDPEDSALWLAVLAKRQSRRRPRRVYARRRHRDSPVAVLAAVPGLPTELARALLDRFGSVAHMLDAGPENWLSVPGVGPKRAQAICEALAQPAVPPTARARSARRDRAT